MGRSLRLLLPPWLAFSRTSHDDMQGVLQLTLPEQAPQSCVKLKNHGSYFSLPVTIGSPGMEMEFLADTGSSAVIVSSCGCNGCPGGECFAEGNDSDTFTLVETPEGFLAAEMTFGSGSLTALLASDTISLGSSHASMSQGLFLEIEQKFDDIALQLQGIIGLGIPMGLAEKVMQKSENGGSEVSQEKSLWKKVVNIFKNMDMPKKDRNVLAFVQDHTPNLRKLNFSDVPQKTIVTASQSGDSAPLSNVDEAESLVEQLPTSAEKSFLLEAGISRFSLCVGADADGNGRVQLNKPRAKRVLTNAGQLHWGLGVSGVYVQGKQVQVDGDAGDARRRVEMCTSDDPDSGSESGCAAIPDSGTTLVVGPEKHVNEILAAVCDSFARCKAAAKASPLERPAMVLKRLMATCDSWLTDDGVASYRQLADELPRVTFRVEGRNSAEELLHLYPWHYVYEMPYSPDNILIRDLDVSFAKLPPQRVCGLAFGTEEYYTDSNGPVWILGTPLFYAYEVGFDIKEVGMYFEEDSCGLCHQESLVISDSTLDSRSGILANRSARPIRQITGPLRKPTFRSSDGF